MIKKVICLASFFLMTQGYADEVDDAGINTVNSFEKLFGVTQGKRRNHTKGFCFEATLIPEPGQINTLSNSSIFSGESNVTGRLSHKGGNNLAADHKHADYGMGLAITSPTGDIHLMSLNTLDFFPVATPQAFAQLTAAQVEGKDAVKKFKENSPDLQRFKAHVANKDKSLIPYEGNTYNSVNSFYLVNNEDKKTPVRFSFVPDQPQAVAIEPKQDFFLENMQHNLDQADIVWNMVITIANDKDIVDNAAIPWEGEHEQLVAAKLNVISISSEEAGKCDAINYDPLVLSPGFEASSDPLLQARRSAYALSFARRLSEKK